MPYRQYSQRSLTLLVRKDGDPLTLASSLRNTVLSLDREQPIYDVKPLERIVSGTIATRRIGVWLLGAFALGALLLAAVGIYGVVSYSVSQRTSEFGLRIALGADPANVVRDAVADTLRTTAIGIGAGLAASYVIAKWISGFLFGVAARDAATFALVPLFVAIVALAACYAPARRAAMVDPVQSLKHE